MLPTCDWCYSLSLSASSCGLDVQTLLSTCLLRASEREKILLQQGHCSLLGSSAWRPRCRLRSHFRVKRSLHQVQTCLPFLREGALVPRMGRLAHGGFHDGSRFPLRVPCCSSSSFRRLLDLGLSSGTCSSSGSAPSLLSMGTYSSSSMPSASMSESVSSVSSELSSSMSLAEVGRAASGMWDHASTLRDCRLGSDLRTRVVVSDVLCCGGRLRLRLRRTAGPSGVIRGCDVAGGSERGLEGEGLARGIEWETEGVTI